MKNIRLSITILFATLCLTQVNAQTRHRQDSLPLISTLRLEVRADFEYTQSLGLPDTLSFNSYSFKGRYFNLHMGGNLTDKLSYYFRQRIVANSGSSNFFDNTDFLYLNYDINKNWSLRIGKDALSVGGFEYDAPPIDVLFSSYYWDNFYCFQLAASASFHSSDGKNTLTAQVANSPYVFYGSPFQKSLFSYSLFWSGNFNHFKTLYSINMFERSKGKFMNYVALGNKLEFDRFCMYVDFIHHATTTKQLFKNFAVISRADIKLTEGAKLFAKAAYEQNLDPLEADHYLATQELWDCLSLPGQQYFYYGLGFEVRPTKCPDVRIHGFVADYCLRNDIIPTSTTLEGCTQHKLNVNLGVSWNIDFIKYFRKK